MGVLRCYTEKKPGFDIEAKSLLEELRGFLKISGLTSLRVINRYDIEGVDESVYDTARFTVFADPQSDEFYDEYPPVFDAGAKILAVEAVPGQYDQRADACEQCLRVIQLGQPDAAPHMKPIARTAKLYAFCGDIPECDFNRMRGYLINPLECREASHDKPGTLIAEYPVPDPVKAISGFITADDETVRSFFSEYNLAMDMADLCFLQSYFRDTEKRDPTVTELRVIDTYWSDHCRHTTFLTHLTDISIKDPDVKAAFESYLKSRREVYGGEAATRPITLMDIATIAAKSLRLSGKLPNVEISDEVNACSVRIDAQVDGKNEEWLLMFKNETHNHPTEVEPFGGAATCVGGAIRDPLSGRAYVYQAMRVTGSADPRTCIEDTIPDKIPQRKLTLTAARGNSSYGNQIGLAAGHVHEIYHPGYAAKRMELGAVVAAVKACNVIRETPVPGDKVILLGGRTGRDGIGGATGSSKAHTDRPVITMASEVQKGNAQEERKIQRLFLDPEVTKMIKKCNDFGAGGISVAVGELADGLDIDLSLVRLKYEGLDGTEIAISESQERMAVVVAAENADRFIAKSESEDLEAYVIAEVTASPRMVMRYKGQVIADLSREFLSTSGATKHASVRVEKRARKADEPAVLANSTKPSPLDSIRSLVSSLRYCSQRGLYEMFDGTAGACGVLMKNGGITQDTPAQVMAALLPVPVGSETTTCSVMSFGFDPYLSSEHPFSGGKTAVVTSVAKLTAAGCDPSLAYLSFQEFFERLRGEPVRWGKPFSALLGAFEAQKELGLAAIGGKDSMSGSYNDLDVPPTLVSFAIAPNDAAHIITPEFKSAGNDIVLFNAGACLADTMRTWKAIRALVEAKTILSAWAVTDGGPAEGIFKMALGNRVGFEMADGLDPDTLFGYAPAAIIAEIARPVHADMPEAMLIGRTIPEPILKIRGDSATLEELRVLWSSTLESVFPTKSTIPAHTAANATTAAATPAATAASTDTAAPAAPAVAATPTASTDSEGLLIPGGSPAAKGVDANKLKSAASGSSFAKPRVLIITYPGATGELDAARAVIRAGGIAKTALIRNMSAGAYAQSVFDTAQAIRESQIILLPGGISFGDEPDGAGKLAALLLRAPGISDAISELLKTRNGLILGIGNGFHALLRLGLVPFGEIIPAYSRAYPQGGASDSPTASCSSLCPADKPTITGNLIHRHQAGYVNIRVVSVNSPWMSLSNVGDMHTVAISHGEGCFSASEAMLGHLISNGQIAAQYTDVNGNPSMDTHINPNGSVMAVEGLFSPDGKVFGKMGHFERSGGHIAKNIYGNKHQPVLESGIHYFI